MAMTVAPVGNAAEIVTAPPVQPGRITDRQLAEIHGRLRSRLSDDGLRAWYPNDVAALLGEVLALHQIVNKACSLLSGPPLYDLPANIGIVELAERLIVAWQPQEEKLYRDKQLKRQRDRVQELGANLASANQRISDLQAEIGRLNAEVAEGQRVRQTLRQTEATLQESEAVSTERSRQIKVLQAEVRELAKTRDDLEAMRQSQAAMLARHAERAEQMRQLTSDLTGVIGSV